MLIYRVIGIIKWDNLHKTLSTVPEHSTLLGSTSCNYYFLSGQSQWCLVPCSVTGEMERVWDRQAWVEADLARDNLGNPGGCWHIGSSLDGQLSLTFQQRREHLDNLAESGTKLPSGFPNVPRVILWQISGPGALSWVQEWTHFGKGAERGIGMAVREYRALLLEQRLKMGSLQLHPGLRSEC